MIRERFAMNSNTQYLATFESIRLVQNMKFEDGKLFFGGHAEHYDHQGHRVYTTNPEYYCSIDYGVLNG